MRLPLPVDYAPMEARVVDELPVGPTWQYEPKWDGFRCLAFRDGSRVELRSKSGQSLTRYFPEVAAAVLAVDARRFVVDGELVVPQASGFSFDALLQRIHPAKSRVDRLARETPAAYLVFDLLVDARGMKLSVKPLSERRERLAEFFDAAVGRSSQAAGLALSPATRSITDARGWLSGRSGTDGVVAKRLDLAYASGERTAMVKIKRKRTADCVVGGFRYATKGRQIGSLLIGLYDDDGLLHHVGFTSSFRASDRTDITAKVEAIAGGSGFTGRAPGGPSRWSTARSSEWVPVEPVLVVEVQYDHFTNGRFRHGTKLLRWRPDKAPSQCRLSQVAEARQEARQESRQAARPRRGATGSTKGSTSRRARSSAPRGATRRR
ncbi:MAG: ATP-dependent DNA ligase [Gemmatimonadales bacterium]